MNITALNINTNTIKAIGRYGAVLRRHEASLPPGIVRNGLILQPETMGREIKSLLHTGKLTGNKVVCAVNSLPFTYRVLNIPEMETSAFHEAVLRTAKNEMSISPDEMYLSWQAYPGDNGEYRVLVTGITRRPVDALVKAFKTAGITPWLLDLPHLALARQCSYRDAVITDLEKDVSNIVMVVDGMPRGMNMVPALPESASLQDQAAQVMDKLAKMVEFYNAGHPAHPLQEPVRLLLTGALLEDDAVLESIRSYAGYNVESLTPQRRQLSGRAIYQVAVNTGMLEIREEDGKLAALSRGLDLNEIAKESRPKVNIGGLLKKIAVPAALVGAVALLAVTWLSLNDYRAQAAKLENDLAKTGSELVQKKVLASEAELLQTRIDNIAAHIEEIEEGQGVIFSSRSYAGDIDTIVDCLPAGVTFDSLEIDTIEITLKGSSAQATPVVAFADNLEACGKFSQAVIIWIDSPRDVGNEQHLSFSIVITRA